MRWKTLDSFTEIGKTGKKHGIQGELKLHVREELLEDVVRHGFLFLNLSGNIVPFAVEGVRYTGSYLIKLEGVDDPREAADLVSKEVFLPTEAVTHKPEAQGHDLKYAVLKGYDIAVNSRVIGRIRDIQQFPQQEMAVVRTEAYGERLIPLNADFILSVDQESRVVEMDLPEGLLRL